jgi:hypothetical protein
MDFVWSLDFMQYLSMAKFRDTSLKEIIEIEFKDAWLYLQEKCEEARDGLKTVHALTYTL